jgi:hypothetical protein
MRRLDTYHTGGTFMMRIFAPMALVAMLCSSAPFAGAEEASGRSGTDAEQRACTPDVFRLCSAAIPNERRIVACLKSNKTKLSPACRKVFS